MLCHVTLIVGLERPGRIVCKEGTVHSCVRYSGCWLIDGGEVVNQLIETCRGVVWLRRHGKRYYAQSEPHGE